jgi:hypothetical protein
LQYVLDYLPRRSRLSFQVDLFHAHGRIPTNLEEVNERGTPRLLLQLRSDCYFVSIRLGAVLGVCSAGEITNVTQAFMHRSSNCSSRPCAANPSPLAAGCARRLV